jgi:hypothetical protein
MLGGAGRFRTNARIALVALGMALLLGLATAPALAAEKDLTDKGEVLVKENCSAATP